jgi:hypothetical protein
MSAAVDPYTDSSRVGPPTAELPITRVDFAEFSRDMLGNFRRLHERHGPIAMIEDCGQRVVFFLSPE